MQDTYLTTKLVGTLPFCWKKKVDTPPTLNDASESEDLTAIGNPLKLGAQPAPRARGVAETVANKEVAARVKKVEIIVKYK